MAMRELAVSNLSESQRWRNSLRTATVAGLLAILAACSSEQSGGETQPSAAAATTSPAAPSELFARTQDWPTILSQMRLRELANTTPGEIKSSVEDCLGYPDGETTFAEPISTEPLVVAIDGSCNYPLQEPAVGLYPQTARIPETLSARPLSGKLVGVECIVERGEEYIYDQREIGSYRWLGVVLQDGTEHYIPWANTAFVALPGNLPNC